MDLQLGVTQTSIESYNTAFVSWIKICFPSIHIGCVRFSIEKYMANKLRMKMTSFTVKGDWLNKSGTKKKSESPTGIKINLPNTRGALYQLNSWWVRLINWVHMWQASCTLLGSTLSKSSRVVINEWRWWILSFVMKYERWTDTSFTAYKVYHVFQCH